MNIWMLAWKTLFRRKSRAVFTGLRPDAGMEEPFPPQVAGGVHGAASWCGPGRQASFCRKRDCLETSGFRTGLSRFKIRDLPVKILRFETEEPSGSLGIPSGQLGVLQHRRIDFHNPAGQRGVHVVFH